MSLTVSHCCWLPLTVSSSSMELMAFPHYLTCLLVVSHCLTRPIKFIDFFICLSLLLAFSNSLSQYHGFATRLLLFSIIAGFLSLFLSELLSFCMSLTLSLYFYLSLTSLLFLWSCWMSLTLSHWFWLSLSISSGCWMSLNVTYYC